MGIVQLPKQFHPDFRERNRKPVRPVALDIPLDDVACCVMLQGRHAYDVKAGKPLVSVGSAKARSIEQGNIGSEFNISDDCYFELAQPVSVDFTVGDFSITWIGRVDPTDTSATIFCGDYNASSNSSYIQMRNNNALRVNPTGGTTITTSTIKAGLFSNTTINTISFGAGSWEFYQNAGETTHTVASGQTGTLDINFVGGYYYAEAAFKFSGRLEFFVIHNRELSAAEVKALHRDVYRQLLKPANDLFFAPATGGGGTTQDVSISLGLSQGMTPAGAAQAQGGITLANSVGCDDVGQAQAQGLSEIASSLGVSPAALAQALASSNLGGTFGVASSGIAQALTTVSLANSLGYSTDGIIAFFVDVSLQTTLGDTFSGQASASGSVALSASMDQTVAALAQTIASITLSSSQGITSSSGQTLDAAISMGLSQGISHLGTFTIQGDVTLSSSLAAQISAAAQTQGSLSLGAQVGLSILAQAAAQAGISLGQVVSIVNTSNSIIAGITTPDGRIFTVELDTRTFVISAQNRTFTVN